MTYLNWHHHHAYGTGDYFGQQHGLGVAPAVVAAAKEAPGVIEFVKGFVSGIFGQRERAGGLDPCCPDPHPSGFKAGSAPVPWPRNSGQGGAPPDFRQIPGPIALKDDACDCIPVIHNGRGWVIGATRMGPTGVDFVPAMDMTNPEFARWIDVATLKTASLKAAISPEAPVERVPTFGPGTTPGEPMIRMAGVAGGPMVIAAVGIALGLMFLGGGKKRRRQ